MFERIWNASILARSRGIYAKVARFECDRAKAAVKLTVKPRLYGGSSGSGSHSWSGKLVLSPLATFSMFTKEDIANSALDAVVARSGVAAAFGRLLLIDSLRLAYAAVAR